MNESINQQLDGWQAKSIRDAAFEKHAAEDVPSKLCQWINESSENRQRFEQLEKTDDAIRIALNDVDVPSDLADKLHAVVAQNSTKSSTTSLTDDEDKPRDVSMLAAAIDDDGTLNPVHREEFAAMFESGNDDSSLQPAKSSPSRRRILSAVAAVATLASAILLGMFFSGMFNDADEVISAEQICLEAASWDPNQADGEWIHDLSLAPADYPASDRLNVSPNQWKEFATDYDQESIAYDMTPPGDAQIYLFAVRSGDQINVPTSFPATPIYSVDGFSIGACIRDGVVYVLLVEGDSDRYRKVVKTASEVV